MGLSGCGVTEPGLTSTNGTGTLVISTQTVNFGKVTVGQTAGATVSVSNTGSASVQIEQIQLQGAAFGVTGQKSLPISVAAGKSYSLGVSFHPSTIGATTGALILTSSLSNDSQVIIALSGTGESTATADPALDGLTCQNALMTKAGTDACTLTLTAPAGTGGLTVALSSGSAAVSVPASVTLASGASSATFTTTVMAVTTATSAVLTATAGTVTESYTIQLGAAAPGLTLQSTSVSFGDVSLNSPATQTVLLTSSGTAALTISAASATGSGFSLPGASFPITLQPGDTANLDIQFDPKATGAATGAVTLTTNTSAGTATIALSGTGETAVASYTVDLSWDAPTDSSDPVEGYDIYRAVSGSSTYQLLNSRIDDVASYADATVQSGTEYSYYVVSVDASGNQSAPSNLFSVSIP